MRMLSLDLKHAVRVLRKNPGFASIVALTLAFGIGANTVIFSVLDTVLLRPLAFEEPETLVRITSDLERAKAEDVGLSVPELFDYGRLSDVFQQISGLFPIDANLTEADQPERVEAILVDVDFFDLLGVEAQLGRTFRAEDYRAGIAEVAVISDELWKRRFGADAAAIGKKFRLDRDLYEIVGVAPRGFRTFRTGDPTDADMWVPAGWLDSPFSRTPIRGAYFLQGALARLSPGVTVERAQARLDGLALELRRLYPDDYLEGAGWAPRVVPLKEDIVRGVRPILLLVGAAVGVILLMVCTNVANLFLARGMDRARELALRQSLGASRRAIARQLLVEAFVLTAVGAVLGLLGAAFGIDLVSRSQELGLPRASQIALDGRVLVFTTAVSIVAGLLFGAAPALQAATVRPFSALHQGRGGDDSGKPARARGVLAIAQCALALLLLSSAALLGRSTLRLLNVDPGFDPENLFTARLWLPQPNLPESGPYFEHGARVRLFQSILERLAAIPGIESASAASLLPLDGDRPLARLEIEGRSNDDGELPSALHSRVSPGYFDAMRIPLVRGRGFSDEDRAGASPVAMVSETLARRYFPGEDPIGRRIRPVSRFGSQDWRTIVGIASDVRVEALDTDPRPLVFLPLYQESNLAVAFLVRTRGFPAGLAEEVAGAVRATDADLPVYAPRSMDDVVLAGVRERRLAAALTASFALVALALALLGIYGVTSYGVRRRTREMGIRMALGAETREILRLVVGGGMTLTLKGIALGLPAALAAGRSLRSLLFQVSPMDPLSFGAIALLLAATAFVASYVPARRAARLDPLIALRQE
jgi:putative ABC transport system permease protein